MTLLSRERRTALEPYLGNASGAAFEVLDSLGSFMEKKLLPASPKIDAGEVAIAPLRAELLRQGLCRIPFPEEYGGLGLPFPAYAMAIELLGHADASTALSVEIHNAVSEGVRAYGSEPQKEKYLRRLVAGEILASFALTEPSSGSDARTMHTKAVRAGGHFSIDGSKMFITNAGEAMVYLVFAATDKGPSAFVVDSPNPGMTFGEGLKKLGMKGSKTSEVLFKGCRVPEDSLLGEEGAGLDYAKNLLHGARIVVAALNVGIAQLAYEEAVSYAKQRTAFGGPISEFQLIREKIADMKTEISAARLLYLQASMARDSGEDFSSEAAQAKVFSTEMSLRVCDSAIQIFGGYGYTTDDLHRHWRDARLLTIGEGTSEVLRMLIARRELARSQ